MYGEFVFASTHPLGATYDNIIVVPTTTLVMYSDRIPTKNICLGYRAQSLRCLRHPSEVIHYPALYFIIDSVQNLNKPWRGAIKCNRLPSCCPTKSELPVVWNQVRLLRFVLFMFFPYWVEEHQTHYLGGSLFWARGEGRGSAGGACACA